MKLEEESRKDAHQQFFIFSRGVSYPNPAFWYFWKIGNFSSSIRDIDWLSESQIEGKEMVKNFAQQKKKLKVYYNGLNSL